MFEPTRLSPAQISLAERTISSNAIFLLAQNCLLRRQPFSLVRMADGELHLWKEAVTGEDPDLEPTRFQSREWRVRLGVEGISQAELLQRLNWAAVECDYFAPSISGLVDPAFDLYDCFPAREHYADIFCFNQWTEEMIKQLYTLAGKIVIVHRNQGTAEALQDRAKRFLGVEVTWVKQESWQQTESLIERLAEIDAPLVLASVGPAGKYVIPRIAKGEGCEDGTRRPKVVLDVGNSVDQYLLFKTWVEDLRVSDPKKAREILESKEYAYLLV